MNVKTYTKESLTHVFWICVSGHVLFYINPVHSISSGETKLTPVSWESGLSRPYKKCLISLCMGTVICSRRRHLELDFWNLIFSHQPKKDPSVIIDHRAFVLVNLQPLSDHACLEPLPWPPGHGVLTPVHLLVLAPHHRTRVQLPVEGSRWQNPSRSGPGNSPYPKEFPKWDQWCLYPGVA